jgi:hypothetical protein
MWAAPGLRTTIAGSWSSSIDGFRRLCKFSPSSVPRRLCVGIGRAFAATGVGSRAHRERGPQIESDLRALVRRMSIENPLWGAPRIHGELLKLGLKSLSRALPSTWSSDAAYRVRDGARFLRNRTGHCRHGLVRCPDHQLRSALCLRHRSARPQRFDPGQCHNKPDGRMDCVSNNRSISLGMMPRNT